MLTRIGTGCLPDQGQSNYLFIVTNKELHIGTGVMLQDLGGDASLVPDAEAVDHLIPPTHIFVASIHEFETLMCHVESGRIDLFRMLEQAALQCENLGDNRYALSELYGAQLPQEVDDTWMPALLREEIQAAAERVERRFTPLARRS